MPDCTTVERRIIEVARYIEDNSDKTLNLGLLAKLAALSPYYFQRQFKGLIGLSPKQYQNAIRMQRLKQALKQGNAITDAIYDAGFGSTSRVYEQLDKQLGMTLSAYRDGGVLEEITFALRQTEYGPLLMAATDRGVCYVQFGECFSTLLAALHQEFPRATLVVSTATDDLDAWISALEAHLAGCGPKPKLPLHLFGTAFQLKVWQFLLSVDSGDTASYKEVAQGIGAAKSFRAVANACGANKVAILVPCHRVLRSGGQLGGYRWGIDRKRALLALEAAEAAVS